MNDNQTQMTHFTKAVPLKEISLDPRAQPREVLDKDLISTYTESLREAGNPVFPPIDVFLDAKGTYHLADGFHRYHAMKKAGYTEIMCDIHKGEIRDAILFSVGANARHGSRRSTSDRRRAVTVLLNDKEWNGWSDREIARQADVSHNFVGDIRSEMAKAGKEQPTVRKAIRAGKPITFKHTPAEKKTKARGARTRQVQHMQANLGEQILRFIELELPSPQETLAEIRAAVDNQDLAEVARKLFKHAYWFNQIGASIEESFRTGVEPEKALATS